MKLKLTRLIPTAPQGTCPRCAGHLPVYPNVVGSGVALSRLTRGSGPAVYVCSTCGNAEAMESFSFGAPLAMTGWAFPPKEVAS